MFSTLIFRRKPRKPKPSPLPTWEPVTILKPVYGLEKNLRENLRSTCLQDYPEFQVIFSVQRENDPAIPLLKEIQREFGEKKVTVAIGTIEKVPNGKIENLLVAMPHARHEILIISDSDIVLRPDYLKTIVPPLADPRVGCVCTLYKAISADSWFEKMELLTLNTEFIINVIFANVTRTSRFCLGASIAIRKSRLEEIGGFMGLAHYLVEDYEMGRRLWESGKPVVIVPYFVDNIMALKTPTQWWNHQLYIDQNIRAANPVGFSLTLLIRSIPFALLFAMIRLCDKTGLLVFGLTVAVRLATTAVILKWGLEDIEGLNALALLPFRDLVGFVSWSLVLMKKSLIWRENEFTLIRSRMIPKK